MTDEERREKRAAYMREWRSRHPGYNGDHPEWQQRSRAKYPEKTRARWRKAGTLYYQRHPERVQANTKQRYRERKTTDPAGLRLNAIYWQHHYKWGITREQFDELKPRLRGPCEICGTVCVRHIDHDHKRKVFRGLLCRQCNNMLGFSREQPNILRKAIDYLKAHGVSET